MTSSPGLTARAGMLVRRPAGLKARLEHGVILDLMPDAFRRGSTGADEPVAAIPRACLTGHSTLETMLASAAESHQGSMRSVSAAGMIRGRV